MPEPPLDPITKIAIAELIRQSRSSEYGPKIEACADPEYIWISGPIHVRALVDAILTQEVAPAAAVIAEIGEAR